MSKSNPNITGKDPKPVQERTGDCWRYKREVTNFGVFGSYENLYSDNDDHQMSFPMPPPVRRK